MFKRLARVCISFAIVAIAYGLYALTAVRWIEPHVRASDSAAESLAGAGKRIDERLHKHDALFKELFPPGAWEREHPKVLESDQAMMLLNEHRPTGENRLELVPCTLLFFPKPRERTGEAPRGSPIVLQARDGAELAFDGPLDLSRGEIGRLIGGRLRGEVVIFRRESAPGAGDGLEVITSDVQMDQQRVETPHPVRFRFGRNSGSGRNLIISLLPAEDTTSQHGPAIGGLKSLELVHVDKVQLHLAGRGLLPGMENLEKKPDGSVTLNASEVAPGQAVAAAAASRFAPPEPPIEITCNGPFFFDALNRVARFEKQVDVIRLNPDGPGDQLNCELLEVKFAERAAADEQTGDPAPASSPAPDNGQSGSAPKKPALPSLSPSELIASGHPVMVRSPSNGAWARAETLSYNIRTRQLRLKGEHPVLLRHGENEVEAPAIQYQPLPNQRLGRVWASGPGSFRGTMRTEESDQPETLQAGWKDELYLRPHESYHVLSLHGAASVKFTEAGSIAAEQIHLWLKEVKQTGGPAPAGADQIQPQRMKAIGGVTIDSPSLGGQTEQLEVWIQHRQPAPRTVGGTGPAKSGPSRSGQAPAPRPAADRLAAPRPTGNSPAKNGPGGFAGLTTSPDQHFDITCDLLRVEIARAGETTTVENVTADGDVRVLETQTAKPGEVPLEITGEHAKVMGAGLPRTTEVTIQGVPAHIRGRGVSARGAVIQLHRGKNELKIDGPGEMQLPMDSDLNGSALARPTMVTANWKKGMDFNGRTMRLMGEVSAATDTQHAVADTIEIALSRPVNFAQPQQRDRPEVREIRLQGGDVWLENRTVEEGRLMSIDQLQVRSLKLDRQTGDIFADGPGWFTSVRRGGTLPAGPLAAASGAAATSAPAADLPASDPDDERLDYLRVDFIRGITGNLNQREIRFEEQVRTVYGPVVDWRDTIDVDSPQRLSENDVLVNCDTLRLAQIGEAREGRQPIELTASGNTVVESQQFWARSHRITYVQAKDLLVLEGDGRSDAQLWRQQQVGGERTRAAARKILYWRGTNKIEVDDARFFNFSQMGGATTR